MPRRIHVRELTVGEVSLSPQQSHHARKVLRLPDGAAVEVFDDRGRSGAGIFLHRGVADALVRVEKISEAQAKGTRLTIASAVPKGERADWMIEKLSELGVDRFIPLAAARSVVLPEGRNKHDRWIRIATEAAKQSRRSGPMAIDTLRDVERLLQEPHGERWVLSTEEGASHIDAGRDRIMGDLVILIGPEGGWSDEELAAFQAAGVRRVRLMDTVLRIETAAVAAAAVVQTLSSV